MAKQHDEASDSQATPVPAPQISMSAEDLKNLILQVVASQQDGNKALADAIRDSKIPYIDPKVAENEEAFRKNTREQQERRRKAVEASQEWCGHIAGSMGDVQDQGNRTCIVWHRFDNGAVVGICTACIRIFKETDKDFRTWYNKPKFNKMSRSGDRYIERTVTTV